MPSARQSLLSSWPDWPFLALILAGCAGGAALERAIPVSGLLDSLFYPGTLGYALPFALLPLPLILLGLRLATRDSRGRFLPGREGWQRALSEFRSGYLHPVRVAEAAGTVLGLSLLINLYGSWKRVIPAVVPFQWDDRFARLDRLAHGGVDPWVPLHAWLGAPSATLVLDHIYYTWLPVMFASLGALVWLPDSRLRLRGLLGAVFVWLGLGAVAATAFSSAGPAYYQHLVAGPDPFAPLLASMATTAEQVPLFAPRLQAALWRLHQTGTTDLYTGISAMPSVHVALPALFAAIGWQVRWWLGTLFGLYTLVILVATVHLGWHYAVDGYLSILLVAAFWWLIRPRAGTALEQQQPTG